jgi:pyruvate dehydrogenase E1 component alpha subunit
MSNTKEGKISKDKIISNDRIKDILYKMILVRRFEEVAGDYYRKGFIGGFCHLYIGQEAVVAGVFEAIKKGDQIITSYRDHGHILLAGTHPNVVMAELFGKETGISKGKGGSMHLFDLENNFYGGHGIVGAQVSLGTGLAFANKYNKEKRVTIAFFGDGAAHQGQVYESFNMAKLWNLPIVYIIENNEYAMGTSVKRSSSNEMLYERGQGFNIPGRRVDGMDVFTVKQEVSLAVEEARKGNGPVLLEMKTYRYRGHSMSDPAKYRTREEVDNTRASKDPIETLKKYAFDSKIFVKPEEYELIEKRVEEEVEEAVQFSINSKEPDLKELYTDVYTDIS